MTTATQERTRHESRFRAMGTTAHVLVDAPHADSLLELAAERVELLEQSWSRFRPTSGLSLLNAQAGRGPIFVGPDLLNLVQRMQDAWQATGGLFDPTVLATVRAHGYDRDFAEIANRPASDLADIRLAAAPGMSAVHIDTCDSTVALPAGIGLDPGAIGKGLAADIVAEELMSAGAHGVLVNLGGDISVRGRLHDEPWSIAIDDERLPRDCDERTHSILLLDTEQAGVATSTTLKRRWAQGRKHHVIDPRTGDLSASPLVQVTVIAHDACTAETLATAALLQEPAAALAGLQAAGTDAILFDSTTTWSTLEGAICG